MARKMVVMRRLNVESGLVIKWRQRAGKESG